MPLNPERKEKFQLEKDHQSHCVTWPFVMHEVQYEQGLVVQEHDDKLFSFLLCHLHL